MSIRLVFRHTITGLSWCTLGLVAWGRVLHGSAVDPGRLSPSATVASDTTTAVNVDPNEAPPTATPWDSTGWTGRVIVGEYITGTFCGACQAHELAFDGLLHRYPARAFLALAYHGTMNFPIADPLDSLWERMYAWYGPPAGGGTAVLPTTQGWDDWIDGHPTSTAAVDLNALMSHTTHELATEYYRTMRRAIDAELHKAPAAALHVQVTPQGGTVATTVTVDSLAPGHPDVYVRVFLVEDTVHLAVKRGPKGEGPRANHYMVVRLAARTDTAPLGLPLHGPGTVQYTFDVAKEQQRLMRYQKLGLSAIPGSAEWEVDAQQEIKNVMAWFPDARDWRMDPKRLHVVALVQDAKTGDILQAQMVLAHGDRLTLP